LGGQNFSGTVLNLNEVHAFGQIGDRVRIAFYEFEFLHFAAGEAENGYETNLFIVVVYGDVVRYGVGVYRKIGPGMILGFQGNSEQHKSTGE
jgi:hypothetical protein